MAETTQETRTEAKHTPGPWTADLAGPRLKHYRVLAEDGASGLSIVVADFITPEAPGASEANARLIAAAPDLLAALVVMLKGDELGEYECQRQGFARLSERREMARAAIAKAEGQ